LACVSILAKKHLKMIWLVILLVILLIAPDVIILLGAMIMMAIVGVLELLMHVLGIEHDREDEERKKKK
jgi:predicted membrane metal-binding protein